jgi:hypothetical protein
VKPLDRVLRDYARPVLAEAGFQRKGRKFWLTAANGDVACVEFEQRAGGAVVMGPVVQAMPKWQTFFVDIGVVPAPRWDWLCNQFPGLAGTLPESSHGLWTSRALPPPEVAEDSVVRESWLIAGQDREQTCGEHLARVLREDVVPLLVRCLDRTEFLKLCRDPAKPLNLPPKDPELILLVDDGPSAELTAALARLDALPPADFPVAAEYAAWVRSRAEAARLA